jgi:hypothetical protein
MNQSFSAFLQWLNESPLAVVIRESVWVFPIIEAIHVLALVIVLGSIARLDLRLLGFALRDRPVTEVASEMLPWTWSSFVIASVCGVLLYVSNPIRYLDISYFGIKMGLLLLAGINMLVFQTLIARNIAAWDNRPVPPRAARVSAGLSLSFWVGIVFLGRFIGFV